jgi:hypothetical protein
MRESIVKVHPASEREVRRCESRRLKEGKRTWTEGREDGVDEGSTSRAGQAAVKVVGSCRRAVRAERG